MFTHLVNVEFHMNMSCIKRNPSNDMDMVFSLFLIGLKMVNGDLTRHRRNAFRPMSGPVHVCFDL